MARTKECAGKRPGDPQLPLYTVTQKSEVAALTFARLRRGKEFWFEGLVRNDDCLPGINAFDFSTSTRVFTDNDGIFPAWEGLQEN